jgi:hypothetical protein
MTASRYNCQNGAGSHQGYGNQSWRRKTMMVTPQISGIMQARRNRRDRHSSRVINNFEKHCSSIAAMLCGPHWLRPRDGDALSRPSAPTSTRSDSASSTMSSGNTAPPSPWSSPPVRAITSTLSTRAAPPVPPASQTYEPLARAVLRRRLLYDILPLSILPVWTSAIGWRMWSSGGISASGVLNTLVTPIHPGTLLMTTTVWVFGVLPLIVLRKSQLTGESMNRDL